MIPVIALCYLKAGHIFQMAFRLTLFFLDLLFQQGKLFFRRQILHQLPYAFDGQEALPVKADSHQPADVFLAVYPEAVFIPHGL